MSLAPQASSSLTSSGRPELARQNSAPILAVGSVEQEVTPRPLFTADGSIRWRPSTADGPANASSLAPPPAARHASLPPAPETEPRQRPGSAPCTATSFANVESRPYTALPTLESTLYTPNPEPTSLRFDFMDCFLGGATGAPPSAQDHSGQGVNFSFSAATPPSDALQQSQGFTDADQSFASNTTSTTTTSSRTHTLSSDTTLVGSDSLASISFGGSEAIKFPANVGCEPVATDLTQLLNVGESSLMQDTVPPTSDVKPSASTNPDINVNATSSAQERSNVSPSFEQMDFDQDSEMDEDEDAEGEDDSDQDGSGVSDVSGYVPQFSVFGPLRPDLNPLLNLGGQSRTQGQTYSSESRHRSDSSSSRKTQGGVQRSSRSTASMARQHASSVLGAAGLGSATRTRSSSKAKKVASDTMSSSVISSILGTQAGTHASVGHASGLTSMAAAQFQYPDPTSHPEAQAALQELRDLAAKSPSSSDGRLRVPFLEQFAEKWMSCFYEEDEEGTVNRAYMNESYRAICKTFGMRPLNPSTFGRLVRTHFPRIHTRRLGPRGNSRYHYTGLSAKFMNDDESDEGVTTRRASLAATRAQRKSVTQITKELSSVRTDRPMNAARAPQKSSAPVVPSSVRPSAATLPGPSMHRRVGAHHLFSPATFAGTPQNQNVPGLPSIGVGSMTPSPSYSDAQLVSSGSAYTPLLLSSPVLTSEGPMIPFGNGNMQGAHGHGSYQVEARPSAHRDDIGFSVQATPSISSTVGSTSSSAAPSTMSYGMHAGMDASMTAEQQLRFRQTRSVPFPSAAHTGAHHPITSMAPGTTTMIVAPPGFPFDVMGLHGVNSMMELASAAMNSIPGLTPGHLAQLQQCGPAAVAASMLLPSPTSWNSSLPAGQYSDKQTGPAF